jgi:hypothetical protein
MKRSWHRRSVNRPCYIVALAACAFMATSIASLVATSKTAFACSCEQSGTDNDTVAFSDIAFVGQVVSTLTLDPPLRDPSVSLDESGTWDVRYRMRVGEAIKGVAVGAIVVIYGSTIGSQCGANTLVPDLAIPVALRERNSGGWRRFHANVVGECGPRATLEGFRALAAVAGEVVPFDSPNIKPATAPESDDGSFDPAAGVATFVEQPSPPVAGLRWWPAIAAMVVLAGVIALGVSTSRRRATRDRGSVSGGVDAG